MDAAAAACAQQRVVLRYAAERGMFICARRARTFMPWRVAEAMPAPPCAAIASRDG